MRSEPAEQAWVRWWAEREHLFATHPQSPLLREQRDASHVPRYYPYTPSMRVLAALGPPPAAVAAVPSSTGGEFDAQPLATARFLLAGAERTLTVHWLAGYAGGILLTFRDATSGRETYGAGRYLLDTAKGADLGAESGRLVLDFNFAYQPSCSYDPRWSCPLAPPENRLDMPVRAGERLRPDPA